MFTAQSVLRIKIIELSDSQNLIMGFGGVQGQDGPTGRQLQSNLLSPIFSLEKTLWDN